MNEGDRRKALSRNFYWSIYFLEKLGEEKGWLITLQIVIPDLIRDLYTVYDADLDTESSSG